MSFPFADSPSINPTSPSRLGDVPAAGGVSADISNKEPRYAAGLTLKHLGADDRALALLGAAADAAAAPLVPGRVARAEHSLATVLTPAGQFRASLRPGEQLCAGDWVLITPDGPAVAEVLPRRTELVRHAAGKKTTGQTLAANVDEVFITVAADQRLSLTKIERFLAVVWESGATPVVVLSKSDLLAPEAGGQLLTAAMGAAPGAEVCLVSVVTGDDIGELAQRLGPGRTAVLIGSSGAGKSSLLNALAGEEVAATSQVREVDGKGKHKTAWRELIVLPGGGAIIDTPGLRGLGMWLDEGGLDATFAEIAELATGCRFTDCAHDTEPGCAVIAAIESGELDPRRLASYRKLEREAAFIARKTDVRARQEESRRWRALSAEARARTRQPTRHS
jgi:ribosome biogenesis GTPase / thiamine phosphate phosphatase